MPDVFGRAQDGRAINSLKYGHIDLVQFRVLVSRVGWTKRAEDQGVEGAEMAAVCASVRVTVLVLERTKLLRSDRPTISMRVFCT